MRGAMELDCKTAPKARIAVVGSGISGLSTAYVLQRNGFQVSVFEKNPRCGGHTLTDTTASPPVDLGFMVFNLKNYPHLNGFFNELEVDSEESDMSFGVSVDGGTTEWASHGLSSIFCQFKNAFSPKFLRMIYDVIRFGSDAKRLLNNPKEGVHLESVGEFLKRNRYSEGFLYNYLLPMSAAIWSSPNSTVLDFPIRTLSQFLSNHCLLDPFGVRPKWRVLKNRGHSYVRKVLEVVKDVRVNCGVQKVKKLRRGGKIVWALYSAKGVEEFDKVVFACHPHQSLKILGEEASPAEAKTLGAITYQPNDIYLHSDPSMMPKNRGAWASWNVLHDSKAPDDSSVFVTYWLNNLQNLPEFTGHRFCTLNPPTPPKNIIRKLTLEHPLLTRAAVEAQGKVDDIQGTRGLYFCGAWTRYGFHEDGILSAVKVCERLNAQIPWEPRSLSPSSTFMQRHCFNIFDMLAKRGIKKGSLRLILPNGTDHSYGEREDLKPMPELPPAFSKALPGGSPGGPAVTLKIMDMNFFVKVISSADIGLGEAWMAHDFETVGSKANCPEFPLFGDKKRPSREPLGVRRSDELTRFIELAIINNDGQKMWKSMSASSILTKVGSVSSWMYHRSRENTQEGSKKNISESYDLSNELFQVLLAPSWMYSCALYETGKESIEEAQIKKVDAIITKANLKKGDHVLEIGCGWGEFAIRAAKTTGCHVTGVTLSREQLHMARERAKEEGVENLIRFQFCDYRKIVPPAGGFDAIVSIEMLEAVGEKYLKTYHETVDRLLKPNGKAVIQVITMPEWRYESYKNRVSSDFIQRYIFPGGFLPSVSACEEAALETDLCLDSKVDIGLSYAPTLRDWRLRLLDARQKVLRMRRKNLPGDVKFDDRFMRMYEFYFAYCEAAFRTRYIGNHHLVWTKDSKRKQRVRMKHKSNTSMTLKSFVSLAAVTVSAIAGVLLFCRVAKSKK
ncbi:hypothetical protein AAMO2058_000895200 [Amorphochlora amoebiformis]